MLTEVCGKPEYNGCPYYSNVGGFDYNSITEEYLETNKEDYITIMNANIDLLKEELYK